MSNRPMQPRIVRGGSTLKVLREAFVKLQVVKWLSSSGCGYIEYKGESEHGVDIKARHLAEGREFLIEAKGDPDPKTTKQPAGVRSNSFLVALGQILCRMEDENTAYAIAVPVSYLPLVYGRLPWQVCQRLDLRYLVVREDGRIEEKGWKDIKEGPPKSPHDLSKDPPSPPKDRESGWDIMKRQMPTSKAVAERLANARKKGRGSHYIRSLESLKKYWEKRGK